MPLVAQSHRRLGDIVAGEGLGDGEDAMSGEVQVEDPLNDGRGLRVRCEPVQAPAFGGFGGGFGCRPRSVSV